MMLTVTKENLHREVLRAPGAVLLDFWAPWAGRGPSPALTVAASRPEVTVGRVNVETEPEIANRFGVARVPTLVLLCNGQEAGRLCGAYTGRALEALLEQAVSGPV